MEYVNKQGYVACLSARSSEAKAWKRGSGPCPSLSGKKDDGEGHHQGRCMTHACRDFDDADTTPIDN